MPAISVFSTEPVSALTQALLATGSGVAIDGTSIVVHQSGQGAINFYDGTVTELGIGAGLLLTSGTTPGLSNTLPWFGQDNSNSSGFSNGDPNIDAVVNSVFQTQSYDATTLEFDFTVSDPNATSISFDIVFGSDEYPEWVDQFVDCAVVIVNGVNYALFNHDPNAPLSVIGSNLAAGYFQDNAGNVLPIEYDGVSHVLKIVAPIIPGGGTNHIEIGIADTGDHIYDSGIFISNLSAGTLPGSGVVNPTTGTSGNDILTGSTQSEIFGCGAGDDTVYAGGGDDIAVCGSGNDSVYAGTGNDVMEGDGGDDFLDGGAGADTAVYFGASSNYLIAGAGAGFSISQIGSSTPDGSDTLNGVEFLQFNDGLFTLNVDGTLTLVPPPVPTPSNSPGAVFINGIASAGNTLTATVSDPDGIGGAIAFQWQLSSDGGVTWTDVVGSGNSYVVDPVDAGSLIQVIASYADNAAHNEIVTSATHTIVNTANGNLVVTLMQIDAPAGASVMNPLTTLLQAATEFGLTLNEASLAIRTVLGLPADINLQHYDAYAILQADPTNATALQVESIAVQAAIFTSLADDDTGLKLALAIINAFDNGQTIDLSNLNDLASLLGIDPVIDPNTGKYPQPLDEIYDRNKTMVDAIADGGGIAVIEAEWQDLLSIHDGIQSTSIADLSIHINQAPIGSSTANLANGAMDTSYTIYASDLLQGFSDPEGGALSIASISADVGSAVDNGDGTFTFTPATGFSGPVELTFTVADDQGASAIGNQMLIVAPNPLPTITSDGGGETASLSIVENQTAVTTVLASDSQPGQSMIYSIIGGSDASLFGIDQATGALTFLSGPDFETPADLDANNVYEVTVRATDDFGAFDDQAISVSLLNLSGVFDGDGNDNLLTGSSEEDIISGFGGNDLLSGLLGNDTLDGGAGNDVMDGGAGEDTASYASATVGVKVTLATSSGQVTGWGTDRLISIEDLIGSAFNDTLSGNGSANSIDGADGNDRLYGNAGDDVLNGGSGDDIVNGGLGADMMAGGAGNDVYYVDNAGDQAFELAGAGTRDRVYASTDYALQAGRAIEYLYANAGSLGLSLHGNEFDNRIYGKDGADTLDGGAGADLLYGGNGNDRLSGGLGRDNLYGQVGDDTFILQPLMADLDYIRDFDSFSDQLEVSSVIFGDSSLQGSGLQGNQFVSNTTGRATSGGDSSTRFVYNTTNGYLYYDADGTGAGARTLVAVLSGAPTLTSTDFNIVP